MPGFRSFFWGGLNAISESVSQSLLLPKSNDHSRLMHEEALISNVHRPFSDIFPSESLTAVLIKKLIRDSASSRS